MNPPKSDPITFVRAPNVFAAKAITFENAKPGNVKPSIAVPGVDGAAERPFVEGSSPQPGAGRR